MMQAPYGADQAPIAEIALVGPAAPKSVTIVHYGPDGVQVATTGQATYAAPASGATLVHYAARLAGGAPHSSSQVALDAAGRVASAAVTLLNPDGSARKLLKADYSGLILNAAGRPQSGTATFSMSNPDGTPTHAAELAYADEAPERYSVDTFAPSQAGTVAGRLEVGFAHATRIGARLTGGQLDLTYLKSGVTLATRSSSVLTAQGTPSRVLATNYADDGHTQRQLVQSDYTGITFDARGKILAGKLVVDVRAPDGTLRSASVFSYSNGKRIGSRLLRLGETIAPSAPAPARSAPGPWTPTRAPDRTRAVTRTDGTLIERHDDWFVTAGGNSAPSEP